jgi:hypothetical protein
MIINVYWASCKVPLFLSDFNEINLFRKTLKYKVFFFFLKILPVGAELFHADGLTERHDEASFRLLQFGERA